MVIRRRLRIVLTILFAACMVWVAWPGLYYFLNDDFYHIPLAAEGHFVHGTLLRPVSDLSLWLDHLIWDKNAWGYHLTNLLIHFINVLLVWSLARELFVRNAGGVALSRRGREAELKAWLAALLFLVYACHSEPVLWIIGRGGSLSTLFFLLAVACYLKRSRSVRWFFLSMACFCIGLFVYESIWIFPLVAWFISAADLRWAGKKGWNKELNYLIGIIVLFGLFLLLRWVQTGSLMGSYEGRMWSKGNLYRLSYNYTALFARNFLPPVANGKIFLFCTGLLLTGLACGTFFILKRRQAGGLLWVLCGLSRWSPYCRPSPWESIRMIPESERFIYLPSVFTVLLVTEGSWLLIRRTGLAAGCCCCC